MTPRISFEFFPPQTLDASFRLWEAAQVLAPLRPGFVSVTYGAGGSTRSRTIETLERLKVHHGFDVAGHLTCVGATRAEVDEVALGYRRLGVKRIVALRGDSPEGMGVRFVQHEGGYRNGADLVAGLARIGDFEISVSAYPEKHPESPDYDTDLDMLAAKADAGAVRAMTQFFFDNRHFEGLRERVARRGIRIELVPGILPIVSFAGTRRMAAQCGTDIPLSLLERFEAVAGDEYAAREVAADFAASQLRGLIDSGVEAFHLYTLNADLMLEVAKRAEVGGFSHRAA
ncbi:MAG: methylenetetrahydrofolate reductase [Rhodobacteraceae bacterium]|nr:methylenetetrahydrofolate reductase [Paracoccaceae bacterium]